MRYADLPVRYADELARTGMRSAGVWGGNDTASVVHVVYGDPGRAPVLARAIHVVPKHWVWYDRPRKRTRWPVTEMPPTDLSWSRADVVALAAPARQRAP
ncbi:hypothetical protein ROT00_00075 [Agromyces mediolanus]|uniref:hypothetical protein n=1 Tax=Agromyces mediolanus TaxID=41986 RepID=UPI0038323BF6